MQWTLENRIPVAFLIALLLIVSLSLFSYQALRGMIEAHTQVAHTHEVSNRLAAVMSTLKDAETGQRGFLLTGQADYLEPYNNASRDIEAQMTQLRELSKDNPAHQRRLESIRQLTEQRLARIRRTIELRRTDGLAAALPVVMTGEGKELMDRIRTLIGEMEGDEQHLLQLREQKAQRATTLALRSGVIFSLLATVLGVVASITINRELRRRRRAEQALQQVNESLERRVTERTAELHASREWFRVTLGSIGDGVIATDTAGQVTYLNPIAEELTGWAQADAAGHPITEVFDIVNQETRRVVENPVSRVLREGIIVGLANHTMLLNRNGHERPIDDSGAPIRNGEGELTGAVLVFRDISERYAAEAALRRSDQQFRQFAENIQDVLWLTDMQEHRVLYVSPAFEVIWGRSAAQLYASSEAWLDGIHPDDRARVKEAFDTLALSGGFDEEYRVVRPDGTERWVRDRGFPIRDESAEVRRVAGIAEDITEQKLIEAERERLFASEQAARTRAEESERWFKSVLDLTPVPILLLEPGSARVTFSNVAADEMAGGDFPKDTPGPEYHRVYYCTNAHGERIPDENMPGVRVARGERLENFEMNWHTPRGVRPLLIFGDTLPAMHGRPATGVVVFQDISHLKQIEARLRQADQLKDEFLATVSHELRTPLNHMLGWIRLLRDDRLSREEAVGALETIERNARAQNRLVDDLLDVSRIITGKLRLEFRQIDLMPISRSVVEASRPAAEARGIELQIVSDRPLARGANGTEPGAGSPRPSHTGFEVMGDADRLQQVVWNLVSNAIKFTDRGGRIEVRLERLADQVSVSVSDTGKGIAPEFLPCVFERFSQADSKSTRRQGGLGLGLAIVRHLVELHGGTVEATSPGEGRGATFAICLPVRAALPQPPPEPLPDGPGPHRNLLQGLHILVVDDEQDTLTLVKAMLERSGARITAASTVVAALECMAADRPDVIVSDIGMPEEDGYSLMTRLRQMTASDAAQIPAIALTAYGRMEDRLRALAAGFQMHVAKPVEPDELVAVVASVSGRFEKGASVQS